MIGAPPRRRIFRRGASRVSPRLRPPRPKLLVAILALVLALGGAWLWIRDSPLVAVNRVQVTGESGPDAGQIRSAATLCSVTRPSLPHTITPQLACWSTASSTSGARPDARTRRRASSSITDR